MGVLIILAGIVVLTDFWLSKKQDDKSNINQSTSDNITIPSIIVPHFDLAKADRQTFLKSIATKEQPKEIVLLSVNHQNIGDNDIVTTKKSWDFGDIKINVDEDLFNKITAENTIVSNDGVFLNEHGVKNVLPDVAVNFPDSKILPIVIKDKTSREKIDLLFEHLKTDCPNCLVVASVDFSHYNPSSLAKIHDATSIAALTNLNLDQIWQAETDSPQCLYLAAKWAESHRAQKFEVVANSNSGEVSTNQDLETTSWVIGGYGLGEKTVDKTTTFVVGGDLMFDRNVWHRYKDLGLSHIFDKLGTRVFWGADLRLANLEGPISSKAIDDDWQSGNMVFNFPPETITALKLIKFNVLSLSNNHSLNAGQNGLANTKKVLTDAGIKSPGNQEGFSADNLARIESPTPLSIITVDELVKQDESAVDTMIKQEKSAGRFVIVIPHWGVEYQSKHDSSQSYLAHGWIDAGADIVVGGHPHVTQDFEIYKNRPVVYSLGNFVFDQFFSKETQEGLLLGGIIKDSSLTLSFFPMKMSNVQMQLMTGAEKASKIGTVLDINSADGFVKISDNTIEIIY